MLEFISLVLIGTGTCFFLYSKYKKDEKLFQNSLILCENFLSELTLWDDFYIPKSVVQKLCSQWLEAKCTFDGLLIFFNFFRIDTYHRFCSHEHTIKDKFIKRNDLFIEEELVRFREFFDTVESKKLTEEQRRSAIVNEDYNLIIASAGSGKTLTVIGKVAYLLNKGIPSTEILVLAFNKKITEEITERFEKMGSPVDVYTMHKLALDICKKNDSSVHVANDNFESSVQKKFFREVIWGKPEAGEVLKYFSYYLYPLPQVNQLENLGDLLRQTQHIKMETLKSLWENHKYKKQERLQTYIGETVKSMGELVIANFLFLNKIEYKYEERYPANDFSYRPDFYLPEYDIWIEHFGVTKDFRGDLKGLTSSYLQEMKMKQDLHKSRGTKLISTYFYEFIELDFWKILGNRLKEQDPRVRFSSPKEEEVRQILNSIQETHPFSGFLTNQSTFLSLFKGRGYEEENLCQIEAAIASDKSNPYMKNRNSLFFSIFQKYYKFYESELKAKGEIDFNDMLIRAIPNVSLSSQYKYIFVDEYQDTSLLRFNFVKALIQEHGATFTAIGDDWQSIYRFAGSDLELFTDFQKYVGSYDRKDLSQTYRYSQELAETASTFIQKNPTQIRKNIFSEKKLSQPIVIMEYTHFAEKASPNRFAVKFMEALDRARLQTDQSITHVLILGRNNSDLKNCKLLKEDEGEDGFSFTGKGFGNESETKWLSHPKYKDIKFEFRTVHRSKGSEADLVFVINNQNYLAGFPNKMASDPVFNCIVNNSESFRYAEERRLFYVALTRTKTYTVLMSPDTESSEFIEELSNYPHVSFIPTESQEFSHRRCPVCETGRLALKQNRETKEYFVACEFKCCPSKSLNSAVIINDSFVPCAKCSSPMVERTNTKTSEKFFGCSKYSEGWCKYTMRIPGNYKTLGEELFKSS